MNCNHDNIITLNGICCRICGEIGGEIVELVGTTQSLRQARRIQDEIASQGDWQASDTNEYSIVYCREKDGNITEELRIERKGTRSWQVIKVAKQLVS